MSGGHEFTVRINTSDKSVDRKEAAEILQWLVSDASKYHEHIDYVTVAPRDMDDHEADRMFKMLDLFTESDIEDAAEFRDRLG
jgi:hypothetical protein